MVIGLIAGLIVYLVWAGVEIDVEQLAWVRDLSLQLVVVLHGPLQAFYTSQYHQQMTESILKEMLEW